MRFNQDQKEGLAKIADNLATACVVAMIAGGLVDHKLGITSYAILSVGFLWSLMAGFDFRKGDKNDN